MPLQPQTGAKIAVQMKGSGWQVPTPPQSPVAFWQNSPGGQAELSVQPPTMQPPR